MAWKILEAEVQEVRDTMSFRSALQNSVHVAIENGLDVPPVLALCGWFGSILALCSRDVVAFVLFFGWVHRARLPSIVSAEEASCFELVAVSYICPN